VNGIECIVKAFGGNVPDRAQLSSKPGERCDFAFVTATETCCGVAARFRSGSSSKEFSTNKERRHSHGVGATGF
jgi:hypothetical protein